MNKKNGKASIIGIIILALVVIAGAGIYYAASHYVVTTERGRVIVPKRFLTFTDTSADIRGWTWDVSQQHTEVCRALEAAGYGDLLPKPPKAPSFIDRAATKAEQVKDATVSAWSRTKAKIHSLTSSNAGVSAATNVPAANAN